MFQPKLGLSALALETGAWVQLAAGETSDAALLLYLTSHGGASALLALLVWSLLPKALATPRLPVLALIWSASFFIPVFGFCGVILAIFALPLLPRRRGTLDFRAVPLPALDPHEKQDVTSFRQAGVRQFLKNDRAPVAQRLRAVVALGNAPSAVSNPMLRELLNDATEDLRLLAYGMLDTREKKINAAIHAERGQYAAAENAAERLLAARRLAGLYWELIYQGLVQGDLMEHAAHEGFKYMSEVMAAEPTNAGVALQFGRLLHHMGRHDEAEAAYRGARVLGLPAPRVEPYRAELAFLRRDFDEVREIIEHLDNWQGLSRLQPVVHLWSRKARDSRQASTTP